ncbi:pyrroline-5-carboxylate reductase [Geobacter metallireducens RCH3]|uniref:Pyrroline-5-carboxylate reductase n=1 Tax=Geobacter metallireducens (strain ATCC 53774 / DSM 7210 / GS-15) TaxID=269799 RepID=Q39X83_GEOMG|nr:pyrroline-5-carboxylate reductase [Geobacter metallireducens]ABB31141.1 Delta-1-pyrroline-5-carboxylate reductase [Geobacter metallireducens GS-15]EHP86922.1 pyrroline-5-carboxylate reductase [Geobacter metallireducens RCH3]
MLKGCRVGFIGGGNMAEAIIRGLLAGGVTAAELVVAEPMAERREFLRETYGIDARADNGEVATMTDALIVAVKPQVFRGMAAALGAAGFAGKLVISIMAGISINGIEEVCGDSSRVIRVMPNTPALVLEGASALSRGKNATDDDLFFAQGIFELVGTTCVVDEKLMDAVTGLSGSGPAYVFMFIEALSDAGVKNGLPRDVATRLAAQTVLGSARLLLETGDHPGVLKEKVTSPGGTTIAGVAALERGSFRGTVMAAVDAATARSAELGKK